MTKYNKTRTLVYYNSYKQQDKPSAELFLLSSNTFRSMPGRNRTVKTNCGVCLQEIVEGKDEAIFCEGKCQQWYHRGCASVPPELFTTLTTSDVSFHCLTCSNTSLQQEVAVLTMAIRRMQETLDIIPKLRDENAALSRELAELREKQNSTSVAKESSASAPSYAQVTGVRPSRRRRNNKPAKQGKDKNQEHSAQPSSTQQFETRSDQSQAQLRQLEHSHGPLVSEKGARKVWNTYKIVTASAISHAINTITGISNLTVKRKYRRNASNNSVSIWWFVIRGEEAVLEQLDSVWSQVQLQTKWELKPLLRYGTAGASSEPADAEASSEFEAGSEPVDTTLTSHEGTNSGVNPLSTTLSSSFHLTHTPNIET